MTSWHDSEHEQITMKPINSEREDIELWLLLEGIYRLSGYDFRNYSISSLKRRVWGFIHLHQLNNISSLQEKLFHDQQVLQNFIRNLSIPVTEMFRDPLFFKSFRENVVPILRTLPYIRIWHAGCSTGEEVYSMAILLHEEGLYDRTRIYATDMNSRALKKAQEGIYGVEKMQIYTRNYMEAGGICSFSEYYTAGYNAVILKPFLQKNIVFAEHNLVTDSSFQEFDVILCRNVMIYFNDSLKEHVHSLFHESLSDLGIFILGVKESLQFTGYRNVYEPLDLKEKIYRKIK